jgi:hypothetical protein
MQSPTLRTTYIRCPPNDTEHLGLKHPWIHVQARDMGREWSLELGLVDRSGHVGILRLSTFQVNMCPRNHHLGPDPGLITCILVDFATRCSLAFIVFQKQPSLKLSSKPSSPPLLHLPLSFPSISSRPLTAWATVTLHLPTLLPHFTSSSLLPRGTEGAHMPVLSGTSLPSGSFSHTSYVKVYATCRLRRIWFSQSGPSKRAPWEFELYGDEYR